MELEKQNKADTVLKIYWIIREVLLKLWMDIFSCDCDLADVSPSSLGSKAHIYLNANICPQSRGTLKRTLDVGFMNEKKLRVGKVLLRLHMLDP